MKVKFELEPRKIYVLKLPEKVNIIQDMVFKMTVRYPIMKKGKRFRRCLL